MSKQKTKIQVWECKIVVKDGELPNGFDFPPRMAAINAIESAGIEVLSCCSNWAGELTKSEMDYFNDNTDGEIYYAGTMDSEFETEH